MNTPASFHLAAAAILSPYTLTISRRSRYSLPSLLGIVVLLGGALPADAATLVYAKAFSTVAGGDGAEQSASSGSVSDIYIGNADVGVTAVGRTSASFGELRAFSTTNMTSGGSLSSRFSSSVAAFQDDFLFNSPGLTGTAGTVRVRFTIDGALSAAGNGTPPNSVYSNSTWAEAAYGFGAGIGLSTTTKSQRLYGDGRLTGTPFLGIQQEMVLNFTYGTLLTDVTLRIGALNAVAAQFTNYTSSSTANLENTATWGGFAEVRNASGDLVNDYTFSSTSGADYTQAIPEPGTVGLLVGAGLLFSFVVARRRMTSNA